MNDNDKNQADDLPMVTELLKQWVRPGTVFEYPEKPIQFTSSPQSAVKTLAVNICSTETKITEALHKLHSQTRLI